MLSARVLPLPADMQFRQVSCRSSSDFDVGSGRCTLVFLPLPPYACSSNSSPASGARTAMSEWPMHKRVLPLPEYINAVRTYGHVSLRLRYWSGRSFVIRQFFPVIFPVSSKKRDLFSENSTRRTDHDLLIIDDLRRSYCISVVIVCCAGSV